MSNNSIDLQKWVRKAASLIISAPVLMVPQAMRAANFTDAQSRDPTLQQRVRRMVASVKKRALDAGVPQRECTTVDIDPNPSPVSAMSSNNTESTTSMDPQPTLLQLEPVRLTVGGSIKSINNAKKVEAVKSKALKAATTLFHAEQQKENGMSAEQVAAAINKRYSDLGPCSRSITRYVNEYKLVGVSPVKRGSPGDIPRTAFESLCVAVESYISINQVNRTCSKIGKQKLAMIVNSVVGKDLAHKRKSYKLINRIVRNKNLDINASKMNSQEARRIAWTKSKYLSMWFDNWGDNLVSLGFAEKNENEDIHIPDDQLVRILNFDETCLSLDGSGSVAGGRPMAVFYNPHLPLVGRATSKTNATTTMITGSNAAGEAIPPHFQFMTAAQSEENQRLRMEMAIYFPPVVCKFGMDEAKPIQVSFGMNEKGGMDEIEFGKYVKNSIIPLYPDACDLPGKRVLIKVDSGPGRLNTELLAELRLLGFYLYPGVPNTTAVTQETDRNYGPFKSRFRSNLADIVDARMDMKKSVSLQPWLVGMIVFGGADPETDFTLTESAFEHGFSKAACLNAWAKVGAAPLTRKCLSDPKVSKTLGDGDSNFDEYLLSIQTANDLATHALNDLAYNGDLLKVKIEENREEAVPLTLPHSKERIDQMRKSTTHSQKFLSTRGDHVTTNDLFIAAESNDVEKEIKELLKVKKARMQAAKVEDEAQAVMARRSTEIEAMQLDKLNVGEVEWLLRWYGVWKGEKMSKSEKVSKLVTVLESKGDPPSIERWTSDDEDRLYKLQNNEITIEDTAVGRKKILWEQQMVAASISMSDEQWQRCVETRKRKFGDVDISGDDEAVENLEIAVTESLDSDGAATK